MLQVVSRNGYREEAAASKGKWNFDYDYDTYPLQHNECIFIMDISNNSLLYCRGFEKTLGYADAEISLPLLLQNIHPDELPQVNHIARLAIIYTNENLVSNHSSLLHLTYRCKKKDGTYAKFLSQSVNLKSDYRGRVQYNLVKLTDISFMDSSEEVYWSFDAPGLDKEAFKKSVYAAQGNIFTKREIEVLMEVDKGLSNRQIAENLYLSRHTVATHRKHILKKTNCNNAHELLAFCKAKGFL